jgi:hypothetical protein
VACGAKHPWCELFSDKVTRFSPGAKVVLSVRNKDTPRINSNDVGLYLCPPSRPHHDSEKTFGITGSAFWIGSGSHQAKATAKNVRRYHTFSYPSPSPFVE